jgi:hypothetical protein
MNQNYWINYYTVEGDADSVEGNIKRANFERSGGEKYSAPVNSG